MEFVMDCGEAVGVDVGVDFGGGRVIDTHKQAVDKATTEYRKYKAKTLSDVEQDYLDSIQFLEQKIDKK